MTYTEFKNAYKYAISKWPDVTTLYNYAGSNEIKIYKTEYVRRGSRWVEISSTEEAAPDTSIFYMNVIEGIPFFRGLGGSDRAYTKYTRFGKLPYEVHSISPDRTKKIKWTFKF